MAKDFTPSIHEPSADRVHGLILKAMREAEAACMDDHAEVLWFMAKLTDTEFDPDTPFSGEALAGDLCTAAYRVGEIMDEHHAQTGVQRTALVNRYGEQVLT